MYISWKVLLLAVTVPQVVSLSLKRDGGENNVLLRRVDEPSKPSFNPDDAALEIKKRQQCSNQNNQGNDSTQVCGNNNEVGTDSSSDDSNVSDSQGLSQSDKIAIGVGVGGGAIALIGVVIAYFQCRRMRRRSGRVPDLPVSALSERSASSRSSPQYTYRPYGRSELDG